MDIQRVRERQRRRLFQQYVIICLIIILTDLTNNSPKKVPYHTSVLTGEGWVMELLAGHPKRIRCELGVHQHVFVELVSQLRSIGYTDSKYVLLDEQVAIFLYTCVTGLTGRHVGERFQRANATISQ